MSESSRQPQPSAPLAESLRPRRMEEVHGQAHLVGPGMPLSPASWSRQPHSMILWGPPGVGKTTLARLLAGGLGGELIALSAVLCGVAQVRAVLDAARAVQGGVRTVLFLDEIHRAGKALQALLPPAVAAGTVILIGATTENPSFTVERRLLELMRVHVLKPLGDADLHRMLRQALVRTPAGVGIDDDAMVALVAHADGDARRCLNLLERSAAAAVASGLRRITLALVDAAGAARTRRFDKGGEQFYDQISALHKSVRGSNPDAALYWLGRMLDGGVDPRYLIRRMTCMAWDDIGLADPRAIRVVHAAADGWQQLGSPDGDLLLAQAAVYLAVAPKSNAGATAYAQAMASARSTRALAVPAHLRYRDTAPAPGHEGNGD